MFRFTMESFLSSPAEKIRLNVNSEITAHEYYDRTNDGAIIAE